MDPIEAFKKMQREGWVHFAPLEMVTTRTAIRLVKHAERRSGQRVLDVACGTGVVAVDRGASWRSSDGTRSHA